MVVLTIFASLSAVTCCHMLEHLGWVGGINALSWALVIEVVGVVVVAKKLSTSSQLAIVDPPGDITVPTTPPRRFLTPDFIGPQSTSTDIAKISRKRSKPDKHEHGNGIECARAGRMLSKVNKSQPMVNSGQP
ncbi:hypothetical protein Tco_1203156 [Tanacetum coccineum]